MKTLSITLADDVYDRIRHIVPSRKISRFISEAVEVKLNEQTDALYKAYLSASQEADREDAIKDWEDISIESWDAERC